MKREEFNKKSREIKLEMQSLQNELKGLQNDFLESQKKIHNVNVGDVLVIRKDKVYISDIIFKYDEIRCILKCVKKDGTFGLKSFDSYGIDIEKIKDYR